MVVLVVCDRAAVQYPHAPPHCRGFTLCGGAHRSAAPAAAARGYCTTRPVAPFTATIRLLLQHHACAPPFDLIARGWRRAGSQSCAKHAVLLNARIARALLKTRILRNFAALVAAATLSALARGLGGAQRHPSQIGRAVVFAARELRDRERDAPKQERCCIR